RPVMVEGRLKLDQWEDKQSGQKRSRLGVILESFQFLDSGGNRTEGGGGDYPDASQSAPQPNPNPAPHIRRPAPEGASPMDDDDVPF
ncbi:MAG: single-stranded DNA-binding protein, partial [Verrucomicrobia bacterium]|nr:single-stranded DNA-binding protein [Verrucomicrobiota bacterium]